MVLASCQRRLIVKMQSLTDLNNYNTSTTLPFTESRPARLLFNPNTALDQSVTVNEGDIFPASVGIEIIDIIDPDNSVPSYTINVSNLNGLTVEWPTVPTGATVTNPSTGVYRISGFDTVADWNAIKYPNIILPSQPPNGYIGVFTYTSTIAYTDAVTGNQTKSWTTTVNVQDVTILTTPLDQRYELNGVTEISNTPNIIDLDSEYPGAIWTVTATPSLLEAVSSMASSSTLGGSFIFNTSTKVFTITGTRTQVNGHLNNLSITSTTTAIDFAYTYLVENDQDNASDSKSQIFKNIDIELLSNPTSNTLTYSEDVDFTITSGPLITDNDYTGSESYTATITVTDSLAITSLSSGGSGGSSSFNSETKVLTITGTKTQVNSHLASISVVMAPDYDDSFIITYTVVKFDSSTASKIQQFLCVSDDGEITNMDITRTYVSNNENSIFATNTPVISDNDNDPANSYTITFNCSFGQFGSDGVNAYTTYSFTGTKAQCNSHFSSVKFYPNANVSANGTFTYTQIKNGVTQVSQSVALEGSVGTFTGRTVTVLDTQTWTPTVLDLLYGQIVEITLVGGGGGGSFGGGGGGQVKYSTTPINFTNTTYTLTVGEGGLAGNANFGSDGGSAGANGGNTTAFGLTALGGGGGQAIVNDEPLGGGTGGYSYAPDGTLYQGGIASKLTSGNLPSSNFGYFGGGGAGSGGRVSVFLDDYARPDPVFPPYHIDAPDYWPNQGYGQNGGIGAYAPLGGITQGAGDDIYRPFYNFGFGGGGGRFIEVTTGAGGIGGYYDLANSIFYSRGGVRAFDDADGNPNSSFPSTAAQDSPRTAAVAGGGGGGGAIFANSLVPPSNGGDGIIIFRIGGK